MYLPLLAIPFGVSKCDRMSLNLARAVKPNLTYYAKLICGKVGWRDTSRGTGGGYGMGAPAYYCADMQSAELAGLQVTHDSACHLAMT